MEKTTLNLSLPKIELWLQCIGREIGLRTIEYPKLVKNGMMKPEDASREKFIMEDLYAFLKELNLNAEKIYPKDID